jgi:glycosyltransferase involved in cell wall biosynthesis
MLEYNSPTISVIMSVYNGAADAPRAIASILEQTYSDFELIVIDNGSFRDDTWAVLTSLKDTIADTRLQLKRLEENIGLAGALNQGIAISRGRYIARQDHDDLSKPERLADQVRFMDANPKCGLLGTRAEIWVGDTPTERAHDHSLDNATLQFDLLANNSFVHSSVMIRREALDAVGVYSRDPARQPPEDFELWSRIARCFEVANLPEKHIIYREMPKSMSRVAHNPFLDKLILICAENIAFWNGLPEPDHRCFDAAALTHGAYDKLSPEAEIESILAVLTLAAKAIAAANPGADLSAQCDQALANVRHHFLIGRGSQPHFQQDTPIVRGIHPVRWAARWLRGMVS